MTNHPDWPRIWAASVAATWRHSFEYSGTATRCELLCWGVLCGVAVALCAMFFPGAILNESVFRHGFAFVCWTYLGPWVPPTRPESLTWQENVPFLVLMAVLAIPSASLAVRRLRDAGHSAWQALWLLLMVALWALRLLCPDLGEPASLEEKGDPFWAATLYWIRPLGTAGFLMCAAFLCSRPASYPPETTASVPQGFWATWLRTLRLYARLQGRATRREWWVWLAFVAGGWLLVRGWQLYAMNTDYGRLFRENPQFHLWLSDVFSLASVWLTPVFWAVSVRRLHDLGKSGRWLAAWLGIPLLLDWLAVLLMAAMPGEPFLVSIGIAAWTLAVWLPAFILASRPGEQKANRYGPAPQEAPQP